MGVTSLWSILQPCARPTKLETLNRKRLAVDASIWIYQFLKAVRDKEGNALRNSHVVGFFRRICKLLFFGIKPVFVFDGGAPALKRSVIRARKARREGRRDDAVRTAGKLLAVQMQRRAEEEEQKRKDDAARPVQQEEEVPDEGLVYVDELMERPDERQAARTKFKKKDAYHLPNLDVSMNEMGGPNDPRVMSLEELEAYARQFDTGEDINVYDFSKIDYDSAFFMSLPASDRYNILNAARLRSRLRMGHSKEQLDSMFPDRMAFSKFQIERVTERNELTQRLMHINGPGDDAQFGINGSGRVAGEKGREYVLVKNDGVEGGWALGVVDTEGRTAEKAIDIDKADQKVKQEESDEDEDFEDVAIEGLNRLPKRQKLDNDLNAALLRQRKAFYASRKGGGTRRRKSRPAQDPNSLFVDDEPVEDVDEQTDWEEVQGDQDLFGEDGGQDEEEDEELQRAIAMSMQEESSPQPEETNGQVQPASDEEDEMREVFQQRVVKEALPAPKGSGRALASVFNKRAGGLGMKSHETTSFGVPVPRPDDSDHEDDALDLQAALAESRRGKRKVTPPGPRFNNVAPSTPGRKSEQNKDKTRDQATEVAKKAGFKGPLPFEKLDLGSSLLGKKKMQERQEEAEGGFVNPALAEQEQKKAEPLPPWFEGSLEHDMQRQKDIEAEDRRKAREFNKQFQFEKVGERSLRRMDTGEVIDLDAEGPQGFKNGEIIDLEDDEPPVKGINEIVGLADEGGVQKMSNAADEQLPKQPKLSEEIKMGDMADDIRAAPPKSRTIDQRQAPPPSTSKPGPFQDDDSEAEDAEFTTDPPSPMKPHAKTNNIARHTTTSGPFGTDESEEEQSKLPGSEEPQKARKIQPAASAPEPVGEQEEIDWSESGDEAARVANEALESETKPAGGPLRQPSRSPSADFEDVPDGPAPARQLSVEPTIPLEDQAESLPAVSGLVAQESVPEGEEFDDFSDPEDEEIMKALAQEAEEHARFASTLNNKTTAQNIADYERELKQLRSQQKKDRRDADEVTHIMIAECQQLLRLFGLPYVTAPMEAEAQCAELVKLGLVDGIVTDDSDCFLFGGTRIYKNFFNSAKFVECYLTSDLEKEFDLTRQKLIDVAHLLGSDYTEGLPGVGPVTALEILGEFRDLAGFKEWWAGVQMNVIPKSEDADKPFRKKFRRNATKLFLPPTFPDARVDIAYLNPEVDADPEQFQWGVPDLDALRSFLMATIGWTQERTDEVLVPVIKDMNRRMDEGTQSNITAFFEGGVGVGARQDGRGGTGQNGEAFAPRRREAPSKRMGSALNRMAATAKVRRGETLPEAEDEQPVVAPGGGPPDKEPVTNGTTKASRKRKAANKAVAEAPAGSDDDASDFEGSRKRSKKAQGPPEKSRS